MRRMKKSKKEGREQEMKKDRKKEERKKKERKKEFPLSVKQSSGGDRGSKIWVFNRFRVSYTFNQ
jgi:restriction endonuclease S subunit